MPKGTQLLLVVVPLLGAHMSIAGGIHLAVKGGERVGCSAIQLFTKNQLQWHARPLSEKQVQAFKDAVSDSSIKRIVAHASYLINLGSPDNKKYIQSIDSMIDEVNRASMLGIPFVVVHPGAHRGRGEDFALNRIISGIDAVVEGSNGSSVKILLETTAGQGSNIGYKFEHLAYIMEKSSYTERLGVCFDTCHVFAAGYDISDEHSYFDTWRKFEDVIGLKNLMVIHLNDSKYPLGSRKDRHMHIGRGYIGITAFSFLVNDDRFKDLPMILETPKEGEMDVRNLKLLRSLIS